MKKKLRSIIVLLIVLLLIIIIILYVMLNKNNISKNDYSLDSANIEDYVKLDETGKNKLAYEKDRNTYYTIISIINRYIDAASANDKETLIDMFDSSYINMYNINENNLSEAIEIEKIENSLGYYKFEAMDVYSVDRDYVTVHFIYGNYYNIADMEKKELNLMIALDNVNETFNIYNYKYMKDNNYDKLEIGDLVNFNIDKIEKRENNTFKYVKISDENMAKNYFENYKNMLIYNKKKAYSILDSDYSNKRFKNEKEFNQYAENKKVEYFTAKIREYKIETSNNGEKVYICKDEKENYYYFIEKDGVLRYTAILDNYTIPNQEFVDQYNKMEDKEKIIVNIKKFILGINDESYYYLYNLLSPEFKQNYFESQDSFENYIKDNFFEKNEISYESVEEQNGIYIYKVKILNADNKNENIDKTIIMKLNEGTDFEMSFNVN